MQMFLLDHNLSYNRVICNLRNSIKYKYFAMNKLE